MHDDRAPREVAVDYLPAAEGFLGLEAYQADPGAAGVVIVQVPFERTSSYGRGSAGGPAAIIEASHQVELRDAALDCEPWSRAGGIATMRPLDLPDDIDGERVAALLEQVVTAHLGAGHRVVTIGGEHTSIVGAVRAHARHFDDLTVLQLDAHSDLRPHYMDDPWNHACAMSRVLDVHGDLVQVGIRSEASEDLEVARSHGVTVFYGERIQRHAARGDDWIGPIADACAGHVYLTLDCDVLDPPAMPATGTPEPCGLSWLQIDQLLERLGGERRVVGFDVSELAPIPGISFPQFTMAKLIYRLIGRMEDSIDR